MSSLMERIAKPAPVGFASEAAREEASYDVTVTILEQRKNGFAPLEGHENLPARLYPYSQGQTIGQFDVNRKITDRIKLVGYYPRLNSSSYARVLQPNGESVMFDVHDIEHDGDRKNTTLVARRRGIDRNK